MKTRFTRIINMAVMLCLILIGYAGCKKNKIAPEPPAELSVVGIAPVKGNSSTIVIITGTGFSTTATDNKVTFNGVDAVVKNATATSLSIQVPLNAGTGKVVVKVGNKTIIGPDFEYEYESIIISSLSVTKGPGGTPVTITGLGFSTNIADNKVTFNGVDAVVSSANLTSLSVVVPVGAGSGKVVVKIGSKTGIGPDFEYEYVYSVSTLAGLGNTQGAVDGAGVDARFKSPVFIKIDGAGNLYVSESSSIRKVTPAGVVSTYAGVINTTGYREGEKSQALFSGPKGLGITSAGVFYIADGSSNRRIRKIGADGIVNTFAGSGLSGYIDGPGAMAKFVAPESLVLDAQSNIYVVDQLGTAIRKIGIDGTVSTFAGCSTGGYMDGEGAVAKFNGINDIIIDSKGNMYVADRANNCIRKITSAGVASTYTGLQASAGYVDGNLSEARFSLPSGLGIDSMDNIYVSDGGTTAPRIRKISAAGIVSTIAGSGVNGIADGLAAQAQFRQPRGIAVSMDGKIIYVIDNTAHTLRKIAAQ